MSDASTPRVADHPVAARQIARARAWAALGGFVIVFWLSHRAGLPFPQAGMRAIVGGIVCRVVAWGVAVSVWRALIPAQIAAAQRRRLVAAQEAAERLSQARARS
jgi:hypothetical protein